MGSKSLETIVKSFLIGVSLGALIALVLEPGKESRSEEYEEDIVDIASEESFPASDSPAY